MLAAAKWKQKMEKKEKEMKLDSFTIRSTLDAKLIPYGGTDVFGWNRAPLQP